MVRSGNGFGKFVCRWNRDGARGIASAPVASEAVFTTETVPDPAVSDELRVEVPASDFGPLHHGEPGLPSVIIQPDVSTDEAGMEPLSAAETFATIVADTLDLERAGTRGVQAILSLLAAAPGYRVPGRDLELTTRRIRDLVEAAKPPGPASQASPSPPPGSRCASQARAWLFADDSAVIYDLDSGVCAQVDRAGFDAWCELVSSDEPWLPEVAESPFVRALHDAGLVLSQEEP